MVVDPADGVLWLKIHEMEGHMQHAAEVRRALSRACVHVKEPLHRRCSMTISISALWILKDMTGT